MGNKYYTEEYIVVFIDLLGAKDKIANDGDEALNIVHCAYDDTMGALNKLFTGTVAASLKPKVKIFSDNIAICFPVKPKEKYKAFAAAALSSEFIQNQFLHKRYLVRGGIALGRCFIDDTMIWGEALAAAYKVESSIAIYPRIVIHPETVDALNLALDKRKQAWITQDVDGLFFVDYMKKRFAGKEELYIMNLLSALDDCDDLIAEAKGNIKVLQKIKWHENYLVEKFNSLERDR